MPNFGQWKGNSIIKAEKSRKSVVPCKLPTHLSLVGAKGLRVSFTSHHGSRHLALPALPCYFTFQDLIHDDQADSMNNGIPKTHTLGNNQPFTNDSLVMHYSLKKFINSPPVTPSFLAPSERHWYPARLIDLVQVPIHPITRVEPSSIWLLLHHYHLYTLFAYSVINAVLLSKACRQRRKAQVPKLKLKHSYSISTVPIGVYTSSTTANSRRRVSFGDLGIVYL